MTFALSAGVFLGTDETTGVTIANNATTTSSEIDILGDTSSTGLLEVTLKFTSTVTAGSMDAKVYFSRITGHAYPDQAPIIGSYAPINGTQSIDLNEFPAHRYMTGAVTNNATGASATNVLLGYELTKQS